MFIYVIILKQVVKIIVSTCFKIEKVEKIFHNIPSLFLPRLQQAYTINH